MMFRAHLATIFYKVKFVEQALFNLRTINRVVKLWNTVCKDVYLDTVSSPSSFKCLVKRRYTLRLVLLMLFMMFTCHVRGPCFVTVRDFVS